MSWQEKGWIVWTGSWDREVGILNLDDLTASEEKELWRNKQRGVHVREAFTPGSLPSNVTYQWSHNK